jgi:hypothetical protein
MFSRLINFGQNSEQKYGGSCKKGQDYESAPCYTKRDNPQFFVKEPVI